MSILINCFRKMTQQSNRNEMKGYKVTNVDRTRKFGVACQNLEELKRKACVKFNIPNEEQKSVAIFLVDGSQIDEEYFLTIEPQTTLILQRPGENLLSDADILYNTLRQVNLEFLTTGDAVTKFLSHNLKSKIAVLNKAINNDDSKTSLSSRDEHPEWFANLETTANTKEAYMHRRCQDRIRSYLYKTIDQIKSSEIYIKNDKAKRHLTDVISYFKLQLREDHFYGFYFDRSYSSERNNDNLEKETREGEEEEEKGAVVKFGNIDELDGRFNCPYDHCPCKIKLNIKYYNDNKIFLNQYLNNIKTETDDNNDDYSLTTDELDAKKILAPQSKKKLKNEVKEYNEKDNYRCSSFKVMPSDKKQCFSLCDNNGIFYCDGIWNADRCSYGQRHSINPYRSYEELVLFSTWNFDHRIERSRTLIPNLLEKILKNEEEEEEDENYTMSQKDVRYFYDNIFTTKNLRLVHIICHDKGSHYNHNNQKQ